LLSISSLGSHPTGLQLQAIMIQRSTIAALQGYPKVGLATQMQMCIPAASTNMQETCCWSSDHTEGARAGSHQHASSTSSSSSNELHMSMHLNHHQCTHQSSLQQLSQFPLTTFATSGFPAAASPRNTPLAAMVQAARNSNVIMRWHQAEPVAASTLGPIPLAMPGLQPLLPGVVRAARRLDREPEPFGRQVGGDEQELDIGEFEDLETDGDEEVEGDGSDFSDEEVEDVVFDSDGDASDDEDNGAGAAKAK